MPENELISRQRRSWLGSPLFPAFDPLFSFARAAIAESINEPAIGRRGSYPRQTLRPIVCLAFVLPCLVVYELGSILSEINLGKSGVDLWIRAWMEPFGIGQLVILPLVTAGILLHWHHGRNDDWRIRPSVLAGMLFESSGLGLILFFAGRGLFFFDDCSTGAAPAASAVGVAASSCWATTIGYIGCGVYEELFFRLILLNSLINVGRRYFSMRGAPLLFTLLTSLIFSGLHYELFNPAGPAFEAAGFLFRFAASCVFCLLFFYRGFGIAVGTHTVYDVLTQF